MKKTAIFILLLLLCFSFTFATDVMKPSGNERIPVENYNKANMVPISKYYSRNNPPAPEYEFIKEPTPIMTSYYDYMPGSYATHPIRIQTEWGDGHYATFIGRPSMESNRRQYWAYMDSDCNIVDWGTISTYDYWQGYGSIGIHPETGNCIAAWHEDFGDDPKVPITYDDYDLIEIPGFWSTPLVVYNDGTNAYCWPYVYIGPSPIGEDYVRVYLLSNNNAHDPFGHPCEDVRIMFTDVENYNGMDLLGLLDIENWSEVTVFTDWRDYSCRPFQSFAIDYNTPGKLAFIGYDAWLEGDLGDMPVNEGIFVWESYDYGETWDYANLHTDGPTDYIYIVENIPGFTDNQQNILDSIEVDVAGWHNTALFDSEGNIHWTYMQQYGFTEEGVGYHFKHYLPQAEAVWDGSNFIFHEIPEMPGTDPLSGHSVPWEIVGDDTLTYTTIGYCLYPADASIFHENTQKQAINLENNWMLQMWADGTYHQMALDEVPGYEDYLEHPIIFISVSMNNGETWSEPIELTDINSTLFDFSEQITVYPYVCDQIVDLGDDWYQIYIYYLDDNSFGSFIHGQGQNNGGQITYCSIKIHPYWSVDPENPNTSIISLINYPNPFSTYTKISFSASKGIKHSSIKIYNTKGQLVRTLEPSYDETPNQGYAIWDGKNDNNNDVANGIYFYKLETNNGSVTNKMLLTK